MSQNPKALEKRLLRLESQCARLRAACACAIAALSIVFLVAQSGEKNDVLTARKFVLLDAKGNRVGELVGTETAELRLRHPTKGTEFGFGVNADGSANFAVRDATGAARLNMGIDEDGNPGIVMQDAKERPLVALGVDPKGTARLVLIPVGARAVAGIDVSTDGRADFYLTDGGRKKIFQIARTAEGSPGMVVRSGGGSLVMGEMTGGGGGYIVKDPKGRTRGTLCLLKKDIPALLLRDGDAVDRVELVVRGDGAHQYIRARDKSVILELPK